MTQHIEARSITPRYILIMVVTMSLATLLLMASANFIAGDTQISYDSKTTAIALAIHLATVIPALVLGAFVMVMKKGTYLHKMLGRIWGTLMMITAISSFGLQGLTGTIGPIHIFSVMTLVSIPRGILAIRAGNRIAHERAMTGPYIGLLVAGLFSFFPGRLLAVLTFG